MGTNGAPDRSAAYILYLKVARPSILLFRIESVTAAVAAKLKPWSIKFHKELLCLRVSSCIFVYLRVSSCIFVDRLKWHDLNHCHSLMLYGQYLGIGDDKDLLPLARTDRAVVDKGAECWQHPTLHPKPEAGQLE